MTAHESGMARELLYATDEADCLVFVPRHVVHDVLDARATLPKCSTWGDARRELPPEYFQELVDNLLGPQHQPPADDDLLDAQELIAGGDWPGVYYGEIVRCLPEEAVDRFGESWSGISDSGTHLPAEHEDRIIEFLQASGIACQEDASVLDLLVE